MLVRDRDGERLTKPAKEMTAYQAASPHSTLILRIVLRGSGQNEVGRKFPGKIGTLFST